MARKKAKPPRKVAIVGTAVSSERAPIEDDSWEIWCVGVRSAHITRCNRWFEIHRLDSLWDGPEWRPLLKKWSHDCELWMFWPESDLGPRVVQYPIEEIKGRFGTYFMTSSLSWMVALAIHEHGNGKPIAELGVWGVDMEFGTEYREQRNGLMHFLTMARLMGIPTNLQIDGGLVYQPVPYPFWMDDPLRNKLNLRREVAEKEVSKRQRMADATSFRMAWLDGALSMKPDKKLQGERDDLAGQVPASLAEIRFYEGAVEEIIWQQDYLKG